jgi:hypothetical protein
MLLVTEIISNLGFSIFISKLCKWDQDSTIAAILLQALTLYSEPLEVECAQLILFLSATDHCDKVLSTLSKGWQRMQLKMMSF